MHKYLIAVVLAAFVIASPAQAKKPRLIKTQINLYESFDRSVTELSDGYVVINTVKLNRTQPEASGEPVTISPEHSDTQIGWVIGNVSEYLIVLKGTHIKRFARDAISLGFNRAGFTVVPASDSRAANAPRVDVEVKSLWMWVVPSGNEYSRHQFHFDLETLVTSDAPELAEIGVVKGSGYRNGSRLTSWKSYRNTALHSMKFFIDNFESRVRSSIEAHNNTEIVPEGDAVSRLTKTLAELDALRGAGTILDDEYEKLRKKAIEDALN